MGEEGAAKLRLKSRAAPGPRGRERSPGTETPPSRLACGFQFLLSAAPFLDSDPRKRIRNKTSTDRRSWFEKEDLNECEKTWILLLQDMGQDFHCPNWDTVPSFPEFLEKRAEEEGPGHQETFTAGIKDFQWVPFPSFHKGRRVNPEDLSPLQPPQGQSTESQPGQAQADKLHSLSSTAEKTCRGTSTDQGKTAAGEDMGGIPNVEASARSQKLPGHTSSAQPLAQSSVKPRGPRQLHTGTAQNSRAEGEEKGKEELPRQPQQGRAPAVPEEEPPGSSEGVQTQSQGSSALDSCPMCLMQFSGRLSQLDIDGHLARCLSESADDVMW